jgi:hypothetical protein
MAEPGTNTEPECVNLVRSPGIDSLESIRCSRFLGSLNVYKFGLCTGLGVAKDKLVDVQCALQMRRYL